MTQNYTECGLTQTHTLPTLGTAILAGSCAQAALMHLCCKSLQSMVPGEAFCQVVCLVVTLLLNAAINVVTYNVQKNTLQVAHYASERSRWKQHVAVLSEMFRIATVATLCLACREP